MRDFLRSFLCLAQTCHRSLLVNTKMYINDRNGTQRQCNTFHFLDVDVACVTDFFFHSSVTLINDDWHEKL